MHWLVSTSSDTATTKAEFCSVRLSLFCDDIRRSWNTFRTYLLWVLMTPTSFLCWKYPSDASDFLTSHLCFEQEYDLLLSSTINTLPTIYYGFLIFVKRYEILLLIILYEFNTILMYNSEAVLCFKLDMLTSYH